MKERERKERKEKREERKEKRAKKKEKRGKRKVRKGMEGAARLEPGPAFVTADLHCRYPPLVVGLRVILRTVSCRL